MMNNSDWQLLLERACRTEFTTRGLGTMPFPAHYGASGDVMRFDKTLNEGRDSEVGVAFMMSRGCTISCSVSSGERDSNTLESEADALSRAKAELCATIVETWRVEDYTVSDDMP